ncbi:MAG: PorP/SprF family type IX secretion system membrane protein [Chitinophagales bacterium]|nr:PorP/SprF family type IX secretion system membrane protein [Chitinophagales bacterium]
MLRIKHKTCKKGICLDRYKIRFSLILVVVLLGFKWVSGQDPVFSQFYNAPLQLNAAFAGNTYTPMINLNYRNQWPGLGNIYTTYAVSYDQYFDKINGGLGISLLTDNAGDGTLKTTGLTGYYSYQIKIKGDLYIKGGLEAGWTNTSLDWNKLQFGDALEAMLDGGTPGGSFIPSREIPADDLSFHQIKIGAGLLLYNPHYYVGLGIKNLNSPNLPFLLSSATTSDQLIQVPVRYSLHAGGQIVLRPGNNNRIGTFLSPNIMLQRQRSFYQINFGALLSVNAIHGGLWYRHAAYNGDALIASFGVKMDFLRITYSFDLTMSDLGLNQGGSHEIGIGINFDYLYPKKQNYNDCFEIFR